MTCTRCEEDARKAKRLADAKAQAAASTAAHPSDGPPLNASDLMVVDRQAVRAFEPADWPVDKHKLVLFYPQTFTPVCMSELGAINQWLPSFAELDCVVIAACADSAEAIADWYQQEPRLQDLGCPTF